ncbi:MAG TPA: NAD(P)H-dependent glycerol-3-phosphate dehydrogenase [Chthoniobacterales bacterium]|nr:NAD(P)H-dependent glycerol-3-phosphate dehydrogenase [Chthoniobacterales bacterium]
MNAKQIAVIGAGGWGTALSVIWTKQGRRVLLWGNNAARVEQIQTTRENTVYLPGVSLPEDIRLTSDLRDCGAADLVVLATPSTVVREITRRFRTLLKNDDAALLSCVKGLEHGTGKRMSEILIETFPEHAVAVLSGPNLAIEVARELPTATVLACTETARAGELQKLLGTPRFRIYTGEELAGIELGGALKNIFAIAAGAGDGLGLGDNSKAALVTRSLAEMIRLGTKMGADARTFYGLSGAGDLTATCFSRHSRNRRVGEQLGQGRSLTEITASMQTVAEGIPTSKSAYECARRLNVDTPIIDEVYALVHKGKSAARAMEDLLARDQKPERG